MALTKQKMEELQSAGVDPLLLKDPMGGLIGVLHTMMATKHSPNPRDTSIGLDAQTGVSRMYLVCIQRGSDEASKIHVS